MEEERKLETMFNILENVSIFNGTIIRNNEREFGKYLRSCNLPIGKTEAEMTKGS